MLLRAQLLNFLLFTISLAFGAGVTLGEITSTSTAEKCAELFHSTDEFHGLDEAATTVVMGPSEPWLITPHERDNRMSAYLTSRFPDDQIDGFEFFAGGAQSLAVRIEHLDGTKEVALLPKALNLEKARQSYLKAYHFMEELEAIDPIGVTYFPKINDANLGVESTSSRTQIPALIMEYATLGSLEQNLSNSDMFGPLASFETHLENMRMVSKPVMVLHKHGSIHGDLKPANFLITDRGDGLIFLLGDLLDISTFGVTASRGFTPAYIPTLTGIHRRNNNIHLLNAGIDRDLHALMVTDQEMLLGSLIGQVDPLHLRSEVMLRFIKVYLARSPHSVDTRIPEMLSAISWVHFSSMEQRVRTFDEAERYHKEHDPDGFFSNYFGPVILAPMERRELALTIATANELRFRFKAGKLGLSPEQNKDINEAFKSLYTSNMLP